MDSTSKNVSLNVRANQLLFSRRDSARILGGISPRTVDLHARSGALKATHVGGRIFFHKSELARFAKQGTR
jgi:Helix-turn-helix domain